ncbi:MAG: LON peptidase substrate-binding domain-containing protein [Pseudomonadales bacterium]|jgi:Lon protease-like protein|nr:LON peptidase substrate-binding domain-containing protein [Pseudomonadales bacterium]MDA0761687.1 LON peptidase substrate-binding domain-containing protein [Pseudomonadota bacterium]MDA0958287.1 LON peptidase substrate-binding domain-containing protein [Pseudomonadota bacterium]MDA1206327.1 LON peptidase substrate-binding domain-containing protein [Pseudomonadota bacterium]
MQEVALFPIPELVAFPGHEIPLHVFEPRYRRMVADCVRVDRPIGVCHTKKQIRPAPQLTTTQEALQVNQATYQPYEVFSAGPCRILETLEDGRLHAAIEMSARYRVVSEVQTLPYKIVQAEALPDEDTDSEYPELQAEINERLLGLIGSEYQPLRDKLMATEWINQSSERFSFKIFQFLRFDADIMQQLLECCSIESRLQMIEGLLEGGPVH